MYGALIEDAAELEGLARANNPRAQVQLGARYSSEVGAGLDRDDDQATYW